MPTQSIIVYRNPLEAAIWEGILPALPYLAMLALVIVVLIVLWVVIKAIFSGTSFKPYRQSGYYGNNDYITGKKNTYNSFSDL